MPADWRPISVRCRADHEYAQEPRQLQWPGGEWQEGDAVISASRRPGGPEFLVLVANRAVELRYVEASDTWEGRPRL